MSFPTFRGFEEEPAEASAVAAPQSRSPTHEGSSYTSGSFQEMHEGHRREGTAESAAGRERDGGNSVVVSTAPGDTSALAGHMMLARECMVSLAADAKHSVQVARVCLGIDAKVQKARESLPLAARLSLQRSVGADAQEAEAASAEQDDAEAQLAEPPALRAQIQRFQDSHTQLRALLSAFEDYMRHRQGLADAGQRIGMALQEAGQHNPGVIGAAIIGCGVAHKQAANRRLEAQNAEELNAMTTLRMHHRAAALDCRRAVREYEAARHELQLLQKARHEARASKQVSGDTQLTPAVEKVATQAEEKVKQHVRVASDTVRAKLAMFEAKHAVDYAAAVAFHMKSVAAEEKRVAEDFANIEGAVSTVLSAAHLAEFHHE